MGQGGTCLGSWKGEPGGEGMRSEGGARGYMSGEG